MAVFEKMLETADEDGFGNVAAITRDSYILAGGYFNRHEIDGELLSVNEFDEGVAEPGAIGDEGAMVFNGGMLGQTSDTGEDGSERGVEGEAFDEGDVEFAAVERLTGDGIERTGGDDAVLDEGDGGVIDFFAEIEADVEVRVRIALVKVIRDR